MNSIMAPFQGFLPFFYKYTVAYTPDTAPQISLINKKDMSEHVCIFTLHFLSLSFSFLSLSFYSSSGFPADFLRKVSC